MKKFIATLAISATLIGATAPAHADDHSDRVVRGAIIGAIFGAVIADMNRPQQPVYPVYDGGHRDHRDYGYNNRYNDPRRPGYARGLDNGGVCGVTTVPRGHHKYDRIETDCRGNVLRVETYRR